MSDTRSAVYSTKEKLLLTQLVKENSVVENKKTDGASVAEKNRAWETITASYNSQPEVNTVRTQQQLRKLWNNLKQRKRKETTELRHDMLATGGGPMKILKPDPVLKFVSDTAAGLDVTVNCPWDSTHIFERERAGISSTSVGHTAEPQEATNKATDELLFLDDSPADPLPSTSTSKGVDEIFFSGNISGKEPSTPSCAVVTMEPTNPVCFSATTPRKGVTIKKGMLPEEKLRRNRQVEATHQQQELHNLKKQIAEEELLRVKADTKRAAQRGEILWEITQLDLQRAKLEHQKAVLEHQRAADEAELASLKLKQFKKQMLSEDD